MSKRYVKQVFKLMFDTEWVLCYLKNAIEKIMLWEE